jgi:acyl carrier protein
MKSIMSNFDEKVRSIFQEVFDNEDLEIHDEMQAKDVEGWDSLTHISLIMAIEESFSIKFSTREVMGFGNVGEMLNCLRGKIKA